MVTQGRNKDLCEHESPPCNRTQYRRRLLCGTWRLEVDGGQNTTGVWKLTYPTERIRVWEDEQRQNQYPSGAFRDLPVPTNLYIEAIEPSVQTGDIEIALEATVQTELNQTITCVDRVRLTTFLLEFAGRDFNVPINGNGMPPAGSDACMVIPDGEALNVSNFVSDQPVSQSLFASAGIDPDLFRVHIENVGQQAAFKASLVVEHDDGSETDPNELGSFYPSSANNKVTRSNHVRLVSDEIDRAAGGPQKLLVALGETVRAEYSPKYKDTFNEWITVTQPFVRKRPVGLPHGTGGSTWNDPVNQRKHDIRMLKIRVHVFDKPNAPGTPSISLAGVQMDVKVLRERMAQATIDVEWDGTVNNLPLPAALNSGLTVSGSEINGQFIFTQFNPGEQAIVIQNAIDDTIDVFYLETVQHSSGPIYAAAYHKAANQVIPAEPRGHNFVVMSTVNINGDPSGPFTLGHEVMHILLDMGHRDQAGMPQDPPTSLFRKATGDNTVTGKKRIGPNSDTAAANAAGHDDTFIIRGVAEFLP